MSSGGINGNAPITNPRNNTPGVLFGDRVYAKSIQVGARTDIIRVFTGWQEWTPTIVSGITSITSTAGTIYRQVGDDVEINFNISFVRAGDGDTVVFGNLPVTPYGNTGTVYACKALLTNTDIFTYSSATAYIDNTVLGTLNVKSVLALVDGSEYLLNGQFSYKASLIAS